MNQLIKKQIKEVQDYFRDKLLSGDFEITEKDKHLFTLSIDGCEFTIWTGNYDIPNTRALYSDKYNFVDIPLTQKQRIKLHSVMKKDIQEYINGDLLKEKRALLKQLKRELNES